MIIEIEGVDGAGKSFVSNELSKELDFEFYKTPKRLKAVREKFDFSSDARFTFYILDCSELPEGNLVLDRYVLSTVAYHSILNPENRESYRTLTTELLDDGILKRPDIVIYLSVSECSRTERIRQRNETYSRYDNDSFFLGKVDECFKELIKEDFLKIGTENYINIDTNNFGKTEVVDLAKKAVEGILTWK